MTAVPAGMALVPVEQVPGVLADTRPPPNQFNGPQADPLDLERLMVLRERITTLEVELASAKEKQRENGDSIKAVADFHKTLKTGALIVAGIFTVCGGGLGFLYSGDIHAARAMLDDYEYCEHHRPGGDKAPDCIIAPVSDEKPASTAGNTD